MTWLYAEAPLPPRVGGTLSVMSMQRSPFSLKSESIHPVPVGSVTASLCSWLIVDKVGSAVLPFGRGLPDWQWPDSAL